MENKQQRTPEQDERTKLAVQRLKELSPRAQRAILEAILEKRQSEREEQANESPQDAQNNQIAADTPKQE